MADASVVLPWTIYVYVLVQSIPYGGRGGGGVGGLGAPSPLSCVN
jgi:hypothetical protein